MSVLRVQFYKVSETLKCLCWLFPCKSLLKVTVKALRYLEAGRVAALPAVVYGDVLSLPLRRGWLKTTSQLCALKELPGGSITLSFSRRLPASLLSTRELAQQPGLHFSVICVALQQRVIFPSKGSCISDNFLRASTGTPWE